MNNKASLLAGISALVAGLFGPTGLADAQAPAPAAATDVVVTGSRVVRDGFQAPTPLTVMTSEEIATTGVKDISEFVQGLPSVVGSRDLQSGSRQTGTGLVGLATPALRNLGTLRTLVLLDGQRTVPSSVTGDIDTSTFPQQLISRVEVVTGGASAAYGSDAVAGVINYVLDKRYTGFKGEISGGQTDYGDDQNGQISLAGGFGFAGGRGHVLLSGEAFSSDGILGKVDGTPPKRRWLYNPDLQFDNPAYNAVTNNTVPSIIRLPNAGDPRAIKNGALIFSPGALRGVAFDANGSTFQYNFGSALAQQGGRMSGGDWALSEVSGATTIDPRLRRQGVFSRVSYDLTDNFSLFGQYAYNKSYARANFCCYQKTDSVIRIDNPFVPAAVRAAGQAGGLTQFTVGTYLPNVSFGGENFRTVTRGVVGADGDFDLLGSSWTMSAYYQLGQFKGKNYQVDNFTTARFTEALDAVISPTTGAIVCRSALTNPNTACKPYNILGGDVASDAAKLYVGLHDKSYLLQTYTQDVGAVSFSGEPFSLWAGPVSLAFGAEHRTEELKSSVDPISAVGGHPGNFNATNGKYSVSEAFIETVVPLLTEQPLAQSLEFNGAFRATDYSVSGRVNTWKAGMTWAPVDGLRFRATRSRDIRAPNITELFNSGAELLVNLDDPFTNTRGVRVAQITTGNRNLKPEEADTIGVGVVMQPSFLPGLSASVDYYEIDVKGAIQNPPTTTQGIVDQCFAGNTSFCQSIQRTNGVITRVFIQPINFVQRVNKGLDIEVGYRTPLSALVSSLPGDIALRWTATHYIEAFADDGITPPVDTVGQGALRSWRHMASFNYSNDPITFTLSARAINDGVANVTNIECDSGCPVSTVNNRTIYVGGNFRPGYIYYDTSLSYDFNAAGADSTLSFSIRNLANKDPYRTPVGGAQGVRGNRGTDDGTYDMLGRSYRVALRFRY